MGAESQSNDVVKSLETKYKLKTKQAKILYEMANHAMPSVEKVQAFLHEAREKYDKTEDGHMKMLEEMQKKFKLPNVSSAMKLMDTATTIETKMITRFFEDSIDKLGPDDIAEVMTD